MIDSVIIIPLLIAYALIIALAGRFILHSDSQQLWRQRFATLIGFVNARFDNAFSTTSNSASQAGNGVLNLANRLCTALFRHKWRCVGTACLLFTPVLLILVLKPAPQLDAYTDNTSGVSPVVSALLRGEQLVPPAPLPPALFSTREIEAERQDVANASRDWLLLEADFRQRLLTVFKLMEKHGYYMVLLEGYRSPERQTALASMGSQVTNAGAYQSYHQYGLAADSAFLRNGKIVISERDPWAMVGYQLYGEYAEAAGLTWGGRWKMMDFGHIELKKHGILAKNK